MKKTWLVVFAIAFLSDLIGIYIQSKSLVYAAKPLVVISLIFYFLSATKESKTGLESLIVRALTFSWLGDLALMFELLEPKFFMVGLLAFLFAHLLYIRFFSIVIKKEVIKIKPALITLVAVYYGALMILLFNHLHEMKIPVMVYGAIISIMYLLALHCLFISIRETGRQLMIGALLFVISDSLLAINKFYNSFELAGIAVMSTYGIAQLLITIGAAKYINSFTKE